VRHLNDLAAGAIDDRAIGSRATSLVSKRQRGFNYVWANCIKCGWLGTGESGSGRADTEIGITPTRQKDQEQD